MKVLFQSEPLGGKLLLNIDDAQMLMGVLGRAQAVKSDYVPGKGYVYTYVPRVEGGEFVMVPEDTVQMPEDLKTMVQVKREIMENTTNLLPNSYVVPGVNMIPDEGMDVE